ncbi:MAG TPA: 5'/3'-nucleotidase SurE [Solirubrobacteraceae bacterium]|nr:5'/3'-nucleotidase SurE [Solirubrobacteraceae bacterium]
MRVLLTNDDGIEADGLQAQRAALLRHVPGIDLLVIAPDGNRSAMARSITTRRPLWVHRVEFADGTHGFATDGTPVDCVRLAQLGLVEDWIPDLVVSGINHGSNIGDDISYSGTVAAAIEAVILGIPGVAVSQQSSSLEFDFRQVGAYDFTHAASFVARLVADLDNVPLPPATLLNVNFPGREPEGVTVARLGRRIYRDELSLVDETDSGSRQYWIYGDAGVDAEERDTDIAAVAAGRVAVTPLHFDLTHHASLESLAAHDLARLLRERV